MVGGVEGGKLREQKMAVQMADFDNLDALDGAPVQAPASSAKSRVSLIRAVTGLLQRRSRGAHVGHFAGDERGCGIQQ